MRLPNALLALSTAALLASCAGGPPIRFNPPQASLQELQRTPDGQWRAHVRLQNFSTGSVEFNNLALKLRIQDGEWASTSSSESVKVGGNNAEILIVTVPFTQASRQELDQRLQKSQPVRYSLSGSVRSVDPGRNNDLQYEGRLNPMPGLDGVFR